jgi:hypothetical protein
MQKIYAFLSGLFSSDHETGNINEFALVVVIVILLIALCISMLLAKKNHLYSRPRQNGTEGLTDQNIS